MSQPISTRNKQIIAFASLIFIPPLGLFLIFWWNLLSNKATTIVAWILIFIALAIGISLYLN